MNVVANSLKLAIKSGNRWAISGRGDESIEEMHERFRKATEWT
jgi:hypothetical protein